MSIVFHRIFVIGLLLISFSGLFFFTFTTANAQQVGGATLKFVPLFPKPEETVTVSLDAYSMDTAGAQIAWYFDNTELTTFKNARSITILAPSLGVTGRVRAVITKQGYLPLSVSENITPAQVDIILEAQTYVPQFYQGRALPSKNAPLRAIAVINDGSGRMASEYSYEWKYNQNVLLGGAVRGQQSILFPMAQFQDDYLTVTAINAQGVSVGEASMTLVPADLDLQFYENIPLRGESRHAANNPFTLVGDETTFYAEPYFAHTDATFGGLTFIWNISGQKVTSPIDPHAITVRRVGVSGQNILNLSIYTTETIPQYINKALSLTF